MVKIYTLISQAYDLHIVINLVSLETKNSAQILFISDSWLFLDYRFTQERSLEISNPVLTE